MANTLDDLYFKYTDKVGKTLEKDRYFQYLFAMVQAGDNKLQQRHQILRKVVDERWIATIEDSLEAINNIIEKPRRFITTSEEVVPVSLAKKITADSVRHLSMNTQFIASNEDGDIQPTRVLNVTTEESYDLYENRFIYHLIHRLIAFVDKRTDVIFWSTGNETSNTLSMESSVDDAYEQISYKLQMTVKNTQSLVENDNDNMQVFMRIDRVRRLVFALRNSAFYSIMNGCAKVRSPIQRTNLMMKDPDYRTCYKLWQFLESYDEVGYTIEPEESTLEFDEEYMIQMYTNLITNYTIFKSIMEADDRDMKELAHKKFRTVKPKFIKQIKEVEVDNRDLPDVEIKQVFVEEVTKAQLEAEAKVEELNQKIEELNQSLEEADEAETQAQRQIQTLYQQLNEALSGQAAAEAELEKSVQEREADTEQFKQQIEQQRSQYEQQFATQKARFEEQLDTQQSQFEVQMDAQQKTYEELSAKREAEHALAIQEWNDKYNSDMDAWEQKYNADLANQEEEYNAKMAGLEQKYDTDMAGQKAQFQRDMTGLQEQYTAEIAELQNKYDTDMASQKAQFQTEMDGLQEQCTAEIAELQNKYDTDMASQKQKYDTDMASQKQKYDTDMSLLKEQQNQRLAQLKEEQEQQKKDLIYQMTEEFNDQMRKLAQQKQQVMLSYQEAENRIQKAEKAKEEAEKKAEGTRLSRFIIANLRGDDKEDRKK